LNDAAPTSRSAAAGAFEPIERRKVYELLSERLATQLGAVYLPGQRLPSERELAEGYGVGRSSVREALRMLESRGLIESRGHGAFTVAARRNRFAHPLDLFIAHGQTGRGQLFEVRRMLEAEAAALAAERRTDEHLARIEAANAEMQAGLDSSDRYIAGDLLFHLTIAEATGNPLIAELMQAIRDRLHEMFGTAYRFPGGPARSVAQHAKIAAAIARREPARARKLMIDHVNRVEREVDALAAES
jgi:GntR family transcriptional repressor for pyruvate dehydrogenase complex